MLAAGGRQVLRVGDRVRAHFQNRYNEKSATTDIGTLLQFTAHEAEVHFDDGAVQCVSKTWVADRIAQWDLDLAPGDLVHSHYTSGKGRTHRTDVGLVLTLLDGGRARIRFQDGVMQTVPMGWVDVVMRLQPGDRVMACFKVKDGAGAKSVKTDLGSILYVLEEEVQVVFDDNVDQTIPKTWVATRTRAWELKVEIGSVADVHFEVGDDGRRSTGTDIGIIVTNACDGRVAVHFEDSVQQSLPLGWIARLREFAAGDRVNAHFKTGGGEKSRDTDAAVVLATTLLEVELYFDDGVQQSVSKTWVAARIRNWSAEVSPEFAIGDVVLAHFKRPGNHCRSMQTDRGIVVAMLPKGQVSIMFQDDVTQVIPKGWIEGLATRWSGQRDTCPPLEPSLIEAAQKEAALLRSACGGSAAVGGLDCVICMDASANGVIVHGETCHQNTCFACAKRLHRNGDSCPICREPIDTVCLLRGASCS